MSSTPALYMIDGYGLIYRSYFAFINRPMLDFEGNNVSALFGFFRMFFSMLKKEDPTHLVVAMDSLTPTFRHEIYEQYKATREKTPEELHDQIPLIEQILTDAGIPVLRKNGLEADDIIAAYCRQAALNNSRGVIVSGDKDLLQLVGETVTALRPVKGDLKRVDRQAVFEEFGIWPEQMIDYLALIGDSADNIPGIKGIGPKGAVKLLSEYQTLEGIYEHLEQCAPALRKKLEEGRQSAQLSRKLVQLDSNTDIQWDLDAFSVDSFSLQAMVPHFERINSKGLAQTAASLAGDDAKYESSGSKQPDLTGMFGSASPTVSEHGGSEKPAEAGSYTAITSLDDLRSLVSRLKEAGTFALDVETDNIVDMLATPVGFSFSCLSGEGFYVPLVAGGKRILEDDQVRSILQDLLSDGQVRIVGQNCKYDLKVLARWGVAVQNVHFDTMLAAWLLDAAAGSYNMDLLAQQYLSYTTIKYSDTVEKGGTFSDVELDAAVRYAAEDADVTYRLFEVFQPLLHERGLDRLLHELEIPILNVLIDMELTGVRLLPERLEEFGREIDTRIGQIEKDIFAEAGYTFNVNSTKQLQELLFEERGLRPVKKTKTGYSTDTSVLEELAKVDVIAQMILEHRGMMKLKNTYIDAFPALIHPETQRIHTNYLQTGTATGRLSSRNPNMQNIPIRSADGRKIRSAFVPSEGRIFLSADYAQIELVLLAHYADDPGLKEAFISEGDVHRHTGSLIFEVPPEQVTDEQRRIAKTINFGVMYGMSPYRLSRELGISRQRASEFIQAYFSRYSGIRDYIDRITAEAREQGKVATMLGHERTIAGITSKNKTEQAAAERIAVNTPIQGTAADIMKLAMLAVTKRIEQESLTAKLLLQVHDELIFEVVPEEAEQLGTAVRQEMERATKLKVPLKVSIETGSSWGEMH
ncbi:MAG: DNA polymerase I [Spirochaetota bacterium]